jgi:predicted  nucleic acid-binding Zn-ribbon protein
VIESLLTMQKEMKAQIGSLAFRMDVHEEELDKMDSGLKNSQEEMKTEIKAGQERMEAMREEMIAHQERIIVKMDVCLEMTKTNPGSVKSVR